MYVIDVIPISRQKIEGSLSYYCTEDSITVGQIALVPLRKKTIPALIINVQKADDIKSIIRNSSFTIRKAEKIIADSPYTDPFLKAVRDTATETLQSEGVLLYHLSPFSLLKETRSCVCGKKTKQFSLNFIQDTPLNREQLYARIVREHFSKNESVFIVVPSIQDAERLKKSLQNGIKKETYMLHSSLSPKKKEKIWKDILLHEHPVLIIGTPTYLSIPRTDIAHIILENEYSDAYYTRNSSSVDMRIFIEHFAKHQKATLTFGGTLLRTETLWRYHEKKSHSATVLEHFLSSAEVTTLDMTEEKKSFIFHPKTKELLCDENRGNTFILTTRKGLSPLTVCQDCGHIVRATESDTPMILYEHPDGNYFYSPHTGEKRSAEELCVSCGSWRLLPLGIGIETVAQELTKLLPHTTVYNLDKDSVRTHAQAKKRIQEFTLDPSGILLGTEMALPYIRDIETCIVTSLDSLFAIPDFRIQEKILRTLTTLRTQTSKQFYIQTRNKSDEIFLHAEKGNLRDFYKKTIQEREMFNLPPFYTLIKVVLRGDKDSVKKISLKITENMSDYLTDAYPARIHTIKNVYTYNILIRVPTAIWPEKKILSILSTLPPDVSVHVNPVDIL